MKAPLKTLAVSIMLALGSASVAQADDKLTIWINGDKGYNGLAEVGTMFEEEMGIKVVVAYPDKLAEKFSQVAATGAGPDIIIWAHDRFGEWAKAGFLAEIKPSKEVKEKLAPFTWDAVSFGGKYVGYPIAVESLSLIYNKDIVATPPTSWEEIKKLDKKLHKEGKSAIAWNLSEPFFTWPLLASGGGYAFKFTNGNYDVKDTGVNDKGAADALEFLVNMIKEKQLSADMDYGVAEASFNKGKVAMTINGPWSWSNINKDINYGVTTLPSFNGNPGKPFVGIMSAGINKGSKNQDLAKEFIENYLLTDKGLKKVNDDKPLGAVALISYQKVLAKDPRIAATMKNAEQGELMPNIPEMAKFWYSEKAAISNAIRGKQSAKVALDEAAKAIVK
jgi:maltose/maltodextrin transport system substrate-binding protein